jgi:methyl-accepting chemotaxis protein
MVEILQRLSAPVFEDEEKTRIARLLNVILPAVAAATALMTVVTVLSGGEPIITVIGTGMASTALLLWVLVRYGLVKLSSMLLSLTILASVTAVICVEGTVRDEITVAYVVCIIVTSLLVGGRATIVVGALCVLAVFVLLQAEIAGLLPPDSGGSSWMTQLAVYGSVFILTALLLSMADRSLRSSLKRTRRTNEELEDAQRALRERVRVEETQRARLEVANQEVQERAAAERVQREALQQVLAQVREAATELGTAAAGILIATTQQAAGASEQSAAISQATSTADEVRTIAGQLVARSRAVADNAQRTVEVSRAGQETVQEAIRGMAQIKARVDVIEENILSLSERVQQIGAIIDTVNEIASQSNMLALNASVEAARAGEHGRGFAVVAQEVRDLAERSRQATAQVKAILSDIQRATNATGMATEEGKKGVDAGVQLVGQMGAAFDQLAQTIDESTQSAAQMVAGGQQQRSGMEQIALVMGNINQATVQSLAGTRQTERAAQELNALARGLGEIVEQFQESD